MLLYLTHDIPSLQTNYNQVTNKRNAWPDELEKLNNDGLHVVHAKILLFFQSLLTDPRQESTMLVPF